MKHKDRNYDIKMVKTGDDPPKHIPVLSKDGNVIGPDHVIVFNKYKDNMKKTDYHLIKFEIDEFDDSPLRFVPSEKDVMWVQEGTTCPEEYCELPGVIWVHKVHPQGKWIEVINMNMTKLRFQFTLNFVDKTITNPTKDDYVALDPGGGNENGGDPPFTDYASVALTGAIVGIGTAALTINAFDASNSLIYGVGGALVGLIVKFLFDRF